jgi:hypothetical protein
MAQRGSKNHSNRKPLKPQGCSCASVPRFARAPATWAPGAWPLRGPRGPFGKLGTLTLMSSWQRSTELRCAAALLAAACGANESTASSRIPSTTDGSSAGSGAGSGATVGRSSGTSGSTGAAGAPGASGSASAGSVRGTASGSSPATGSSGDVAGTGCSGVCPPLVSMTNTFSANRTTISTSEGAPYADCDFWTYGTDCTEQSNFGLGRPGSCACMSA